MKPQVYRQQIQETGIEDLEIDISSLEKSMRTLHKLDDMEEVLKKIRHDLRSDMRKIRLEYVNKMKEVNESPQKVGSVGNYQLIKSSRKRKK